MTGLILALPSKGRLQQQCAEYFADSGLDIEKTDGARGYAARMPAMPGIEVRMLSAGDIARTLRRGEVHLGVTGEDVLREADPGLARSVLIKALGFGRADLVLAAPQCWLDVVSVADFAEVAALHRARTGERLRVATKYMAQAHAFLDERGVADYRLVESLGATEAAPANGAAEAIIDITTTGATLSANHLRPLRDGTILKSQAQLVASAAADWTPDALAVLAPLIDVIDARARAKAHRLLRVSPGPDGRAALVKRAEELGCAVSSADQGPVLELQCPAERVLSVCAALQPLSGGDIGVVETDFLFERPSPAFAAFIAALATKR